MWLNWRDFAKKTICQKVMAKRKIDKKNIEIRFGGVKNGGESLPHARTPLLATPSSGDTPQRLAWLQKTSNLQYTRTTAGLQ